MDLQQTFFDATRFSLRYDTEDKQNTVHFCKLLDGAWDTWTDAIDVPLAFYSAQPVAVNNFLFLHGVDARFIGNVMQRFDGATRTWLHLTPIPQQATVSHVSHLHSGASRCEACTGIVSRCISPL